MPGPRYCCPLCHLTILLSPSFSAMTTVSGPSAVHIVPRNVTSTEPALRSVVGRRAEPKSPIASKIIEPASPPAVIRLKYKVAVSRLVRKTEQQVPIDPGIPPVNIHHFSFVGSRCENAATAWRNLAGCCTKKVAVAAKTTTHGANTEGHQASQWPGWRWHKR